MSSTIKMNRAMATLLASLRGPSEIVAPSPYRALVDNGLEEVEGCVFFRELLLSTSHVRIREGDFGIHLDRTGYECSANKIHLEDYLEPHMARDVLSLARTAVECAAYLAERLRAFSTHRFRIIVGTDDEVVASCTLRFHTLRRGESWLAEDLDAYEQPVYVMDTLSTAHSG